MDSLKVAVDKGPDRTFQINVKLLGRALYDCRLPDSHKAIVDEAYSNGLVDPLQMEDPVEAALQIVNLVAVDRPTSMFTRLIL